MLYAQRKTYFFLLDRIFCCHFDGLIVLLKSFSSSAGTSYALSSQTSLSGITHSSLQHDRRKEAGSSLSKGISTNLLPATFLCIGHTSKVWISARQFFRFFFFDIFSFLGSGSKSCIIVVGEVGAIQVMINSSPDYLRHLQLI